MSIGLKVAWICVYSPHGPGHSCEVSAITQGSQIRQATRAIDDLKEYLTFPIAFAKRSAVKLRSG